MRSEKKHSQHCTTSARQQQKNTDRRKEKWGHVPQSKASLAASIAALGFSERKSEIALHNKSHNTNTQRSKEKCEHKCECYTDTWPHNDPRMRQTFRSIPQCPFSHNPAAHSQSNSFASWSCHPEMRLNIAGTLPLPIHNGTTQTNHARETCNTGNDIGKRSLANTRCDTQTARTMIHQDRLLRSQAPSSHSLFRPLAIEVRRYTAHDTARQSGAANTTTHTKK